MHDVCPHLVQDAFKILISCLKRLLFMIFKSKSGNFHFQACFDQKVRQGTSDCFDIYFSSYQQKTGSGNGSFCSVIMIYVHWIARKVSILGYMLLHKLYINMAHAGISHRCRSFWDLPSPKYYIYVNIQTICGAK